MYCWQCGSLLPQGALFCGQCGKVAAVAALPLVGNVVVAPLLPHEITVSKVKTGKNIQIIGAVLSAVGALISLFGVFILENMGIGVFGLVVLLVGVVARTMGKFEDWNHSE
jgi:hypothetical protein